MTTAIYGVTKDSPLTGEDVRSIMKGYFQKNGAEYNMEDYVVQRASDTMLGFLADYCKLKVYLSSGSNKRITEHFFVKSIPRNNDAKAALVRDFGVFYTETVFYTDIKVRLEVPGIKSWSPKLIASLDDAIVFEDLNAKGYRIMDKFQRFDKAHALQGLRTLARFHASSIIVEENKKTQLNTSYSLTDDCGALSREGGYVETDAWFVQCREGGLEVIKACSQYGQREVFQHIEKAWATIWNSALQISGRSKEYRNVVCHRDLWNNNIFFHYKEALGNFEPDDCMLVDFQAVKYQPPACDVMLFLYCNLDRELRERNMDAFLNFYYKELEAVLEEHNVSVTNVLSKTCFMKSAEQQRQWGLIAFACLVTTIFMDDEATTRTFTDTKKFDQILTKDKGTFMKARMQEDAFYRNIVLETLEEVVERFCLQM